MSACGRWWGVSLTPSVRASCPASQMAVTGGTGARANLTRAWTFAVTEWVFEFDSLLVLHVGCVVVYHCWSQRPQNGLYTCLLKLWASHSRSIFIMDIWQLKHCKSLLVCWSDVCRSWSSFNVAQEGFVLLTQFWHSDTWLFWQAVCCTADNNSRQLSWSCAQSSDSLLSLCVLN